MLHDVKTTEIVNLKDFLTNIHELGKKMKVNVNRLVSLSKKNLEKYDNSACYDDDTTPPDIPEWDPGLRPVVLTDGQKRYLVTKGPHQPKLPRFPNDNIPFNKQQQFSVQWHVDHPHFEYSIAKNAAFCFVCSLFRTPSSYNWCLIMEQNDRYG